MSGACKLATYHALFAVPFDPSAPASAPLPRHSFLDLSQRELLDISRFRLRAHNFRVETATWNTGTLLYVTVVLVLRYKMRCMLS